MKIDRHGSGAFHGVSSIEFQAPKFKWNNDNMSAQIIQNRVKDFTGGSRHDYVVSLSLNEISQLIRATADVATLDPAAFSPHMANLLAPLLQLQAVGSGVIRA